MKLIRNTIFVLTIVFSFQTIVFASPICEKIYEKINQHGCTILTKLPQAQKLCDLANQGSEEVCEFCWENPQICLAVASIILATPHPFDNQLTETNV